ncbi:hypothetical protein Fmac_021354 [Flemingia macrophylla]|uniref:Uncharacterized protein n=1 Tax=Flemingia macrophylla TaxID=520843 RepID=A0ABD1LWM3_9FABA
MQLHDDLNTHASLPCRSASSLSRFCRLTHKNRTRTMILSSIAKNLGAGIYNIGIYGFKGITMYKITIVVGLMSLGLIDLEILQRSGSSTKKKQAGSYLT